MQPRISVLLVDDHHLVRRGFRAILEDENDIEVIGEASDGDEAIQLARKLRPQVVLMDCALPTVSGLIATKEILAEFPDTAVLMLSMHSEDTLVRQALDAGASGYILKNAVDLELPAAVRKVAAGERVLAPQLERSVALKGERHSALTTRELEILHNLQSHGWDFPQGRIRVVVIKLWRARRAVLGARWIGRFFEPNDLAAVFLAALEDIDLGVLWLVVPDAHNVVACGQARSHCS